MKRLKDIVSKVIGLNYEKEIIISGLDLNKSFRYNIKKELFNNYKLKPFEEKDKDALMALCEENNPSELHEIIRYIKKRYNGILFFRDTILFGYLWWHDMRLKGYHDDLGRLPIKLKQEKEIFCVDFYIKPDHRGQGIALYLLSEIYLKWHKNGYRRLYGYTATDNISAIWIYRILAWEEIRRIKEYSIRIKKRKTVFLFYGTHPNDLYLFFAKYTNRFFRKVLKLT